MSHLPFVNGSVERRRVNYPVMFIYYSVLSERSGDSSLTADKDPLFESWARTTNAQQCDCFGFSLTWDCLKSSPNKTSLSRKTWALSPYRCENAIPSPSWRLSRGGKHLRKTLRLYRWHWRLLPYSFFTNKTQKTSPYQRLYSIIEFFPFRLYYAGLVNLSDYVVFSVLRISIFDIISFWLTALFVCFLSLTRSRLSAPIIKERPNSAIYPSDSLRTSLLGSRRGRSTLSLSKSVSTNNIAGWGTEKKKSKRSLVFFFFFSFLYPNCSNGIRRF